MKLLLQRRWFTDKSTIGELYLDGVHSCFVLEDRFRLPFEPKVPRATCIPCGTFPLIITHSNRFGVEMPLLLNVPNFSGVRIHTGNTASDTEGCLLPGMEREQDKVLRSRDAYQILFLKLWAATEPMSITITALFT